MSVPGSAQILFSGSGGGGSGGGGSGGGGSGGGGSGGGGSGGGGLPMINQDLGEYAHTYQTTMDFGQYWHTFTGIGTLGRIDLGEYNRITIGAGTLGRFDLGEYASAPQQPPDIFDSARRFSPIYLTNGSLTAASTSPLFGVVLSTVYQATGVSVVRYCEFTLNNGSGGFNMGLVKMSFPWGADSVYVGYTPDSYGISPSLKWNNDRNSPYGKSFSSGTVVGMTFDAGAATLSFSVGGVDQGVAFTGLSGAFCPAVSVETAGGVSSQITVNFGDSSWAHSPPSGTIGWRH